MQQEWIVKDTQINIQGEELVLNAFRAVYWKKEKMLIVADMHLGKTAHFRAAGISVPSSIIKTDLDRLTYLIGTYQPKILLVVGDMFHHQKMNSDLDIFKDWRNQFEKLSIYLVQGNHDRLKNLYYQNMGIELFKPNLNLGLFQFVHEYVEPNEKYFSISGHIHPGVLLKGKAKQAIKLPCFAVSNHHLILPAFSLFTGLDIGYCKDECSFYAIADNKVFLMK